MTSRRARPLDPRLLRHAKAARGYVLLTALLGVLTAAAIVVQAFLVAHVIAGVATQGHTGQDVRTPLLWLVVVLLARTVLAWTQERYAQRAATRVVGQLRLRLLEHVAALGPGWLAQEARAASLVTLATRGLDALDGYLVRYLPQLLLVATVTPGVLAVVLTQDLVSAGLIALTLPLVPLFMVLVGLATQSMADRKLRLMRRLGAQVLDLVAGLPTLRALGRDRSQARRVRQVGEAYRVATMGTLRSAFLSALVLETLTTLSVAVVAVGIGLRLVSGGLDLRTGLTVLILTPEVYLPLRMVGVHYHASVDGLAAATEAFGVLDRAPRPTGRTPAPDLRRHEVLLDGVSVEHAGRHVVTPHALSARLCPGRLVALSGPSGSGKSTALEVLLGLRVPDAGRVLVSPGTHHHAGVAVEQGAAVPAGVAATAGHLRACWQCPVSRLRGPLPAPDRVVVGADSSTIGPSCRLVGHSPGHLLAREGHCQQALSHAPPVAPALPQARSYDLTDLDPESWRRQVSWVPQRPTLVPGSLEDNLRLTRPRACAQDLADAARRSGLAEVVRDLPEGWSTRVGTGGVGLSAGQCQRLALARALLAPAPLVVLDEPTAHLDTRSQETVHAALLELRDAGHTVVVATHRPPLLALADVVVPVGSAPLPEEPA